MDELRTILGDTAHRLMGNTVTRAMLEAAEQGTWPELLWLALEEHGLTRVLVPEAQGGAGANGLEAAIVLKAAGYHALPVPLAETVIARFLLAKAGVEGLPGQKSSIQDPSAQDSGKGALTVLTGCEVDGENNRLSGIATRVPWGRFCSHGVVLVERHAQVYVGYVLLADGEITPGLNLAREPRDTIRFDGVPVTLHPVSGLVADVAVYAAAARACQMAGALERLSALGVGYANERQQFGRAIGKFQAIQQQLAVLSTQAAAAGMAADHGMVHMEGPEALFEVAIAKTRTDVAVNEATGIAHQVHGAIGFSYEHMLHFFTRRLWSWRAEFGSGKYWAQILGRRAVEAGAEALWPSVTDPGQS